MAEVGNRDVEILEKEIEELDAARPDAAVGGKHLGWEFATICGLALAAAILGLGGFLAAALILGGRIFLNDDHPRPL
jgi:hypothetical protein